MVSSKNAECYDCLCGMSALECLFQHRQSKLARPGVLSNPWSLNEPTCIHPRASDNPPPGGKGGEGSWHPYTWNAFNEGNDNYDQSQSFPLFPCCPIPPCLRCPNPSQLFRGLFMKTVFRVGRKELPLLLWLKRNLLASNSLFHPLKIMYLH